MGKHITGAQQNSSAEERKTEGEEQSRRCVVQDVEHIYRISEYKLCRLQTCHCPTGPMLLLSCIPAEELNNALLQMEA